MTTHLPKLQRLSERVFRVLGCNPSAVTMQGTNTYLVGSGNRQILIDTGEGVPEYNDCMKQACLQLNCSIQEVIITHWHLDHSGGVSDIRRLTNSVNLKVSKLPRVPFQEETIDYGGGYTFVSHGGLITTDGATLRVLHTPGHTDDHMALLLEEEGAVFSGDCVLGETTAVFENLRDYMNSLKAIMNLVPSLIYPGHGPVVRNAVGWLKNYITHREQREMQLLSAMQAEPSHSYTPSDLVSIVYTDIPTNLVRLAIINVHQHLTKLEEEGKIDSPLTMYRRNILPTFW
uniref:Endoribonuclease LACTB2 n=1 Tax=Eptatretus burgeri TaxID=7764 RepID=A0A8C4Q5K7_EPTBU